MILLFKNLLYTLLVPGLLVGWLPLRVFESRADWPAWLSWTHWLGLGLIVAGTAAYFHCLWHLMHKGQGTPLPFDPPRRLVQRGLYRWTRNPCYVAVLVTVTGEALFLQSWHVAVYLVCLACVLQLLVVLHEEPALGFRFGAMYEDYKRAVPRWWPKRPPPVEAGRGP